MKAILAVLAGLFALSASPALAEHKPTYWEHTKDCLSLFFRDHAAHSRLCTPSRVETEFGSIYSLEGDGSAPPVSEPDEPEVVKPGKPKKPRKHYHKKKWRWKHKAN